MQCGVGKGQFCPSLISNLLLWVLPTAIVATVALLSRPVFLQDLLPTLWVAVPTVPLPGHTLMGTPSRCLRIRSPPL